MRCRANSVLKSGWCEHGLSMANCQISRNAAAFEVLILLPRCNNGCVNSESGDFNNRGELIGQSKLAGDLANHPFLWDGEKLIDLNTSAIGGNPITATA